MYVQMPVDQAAKGQIRELALKIQANFPNFDHIYLRRTFRPESVDTWWSDGLGLWLSPQKLQLSDRQRTMQFHVWAASDLGEAGVSSLRAYLRITGYEGDRQPTWETLTSDVIIKMYSRRKVRWDAVLDWRAHEEERLSQLGRDDLLILLKSLHQYFQAFR